MVSRWKSATRTKGTGGMEGCVVLFKPRINLCACTHPSVSNTLECNDWLVHKPTCTVLCSNTFGFWFLVVFKHQTPPCVSNTFGLWFLLVYKHQSPPCVSTTFGLWFRVCVQASVYSPLIKHCWIVVPCCVHASVSSPVFQTRLDYGSVSVYKHQSPALCFKHVWFVVPCLCTRICLQPSFKHV